MSNINLTQAKLEALRSEYKHRNVRGKYPRQKMLPEYQSLYPWVLPDEEDPYFAFCTICECRLSAKRSDLGKHEGSMKHSENAAKKQVEGNVVLKGSHQLCNETETDESKQAGDSAQAEETNDDDIYIKQEPIIDLVENSNEINLKETIELSEDNEDEEEDDGEEEEEEEGEEDDEDECDEQDEDYEPPCKRLNSDTDSHSQHSSVLDCLPVKVTINEQGNSVQRFSIREIPVTTASTLTAAVAASYASTVSNQTTNTLTSAASIHFASQPASAVIPTSQTPCKITIKKITAPLGPATASQVTTPGAAIATMPASITISQQPNNFSTVAGGVSMNSSIMAQSVVQSQAKTTATTSPALSLPSLQAAPPPPRDSFDLFFDSICASVKALPPKLATEGKIRVMQLIGELEIRAITEREQEETAANANGSGTSGQQNSTVASTTK